MAQEALPNVPRNSPQKTQREQRKNTCALRCGIVRKTIAFALALFGLFDSLYLLCVYVSPSHPMVCLGSGCDVVRASAYAHLLGIPTPAFGVLIYAVLAALMFAETQVARGDFLRRAVLGIAAAGVAASAALTYIEAAVIHAWCAWCVAQAIAAALIFLLAVTNLRSGYADAAARRAAAGRYWKALMVAIIAGSAAFYFLARAEQKQAEAPPLSAETIAARVVRPESHVTGNPQSLVTFAEFGDLQCPACAASYPIVRELRKQFGDRVGFVFRHFPLETNHPFALKSAQAAECAAQQGKFWEMVDRTFEAKGDLRDESLERYAAEVGVDKASFHECLVSGATLPQIRQDQEDGRALGLRSVPTFFVGKRRIEGALTEYQFSTMLLDDLQSAGMLKSGAAAPIAPGNTNPVAQEKQAPAAGAALSMGGGTSSGGFFNVQGASTDCSEDAPKGPEPPLIHTPDAQTRREQGTVFVDVRSAEEFAKGHIKGAVNLPLLEVERRAGELAKDKAIVVYEGGTAAAGDVCAASKSAARVLISRGYKAVVYRDGLKDWEKAGGAVEK
jgi:protein-disulfide isomerase/rhodanese-related sulfurtransferase